MAFYSPTIAYQDRRDSSLRRSWPGDGLYVNDEHMGIFEQTRDIPGWQLEGDTYKLYEMGYHAGDVILEIGTFGGRSAVVELKGALASRGRSAPPQFFGIDIDPDAICRSGHTLRAHPELIPHAVLFQGDLAAFVRRYPISPSMVFLDGDHRYDGVKKDFEILSRLLGPGVPVLCHDYLNPENDTGQYGVRQAAHEWEADGLAEFFGVFGCSALYVTTHRCSGRPVTGLSPEAFQRACAVLGLGHRGPVSGRVSTFAVVVPNRDQSRFLPDALESLSCQRVPFELAVVDGGSQDGFHTVVAPYQTLITWQRSAPDHGQAAAIREGMGRLNGDVVAWLNADDYYFPETFERVAAVFNSRPEVDVVYGDAVHVDADGMFRSYFLPAREFDRRLLTRNLFICQPACFVRKSAYDRVGGVDERLHYTMDWDLWCRLAADGATFAYLREPLAAVRVHPGTKTLSGRRRRYREIFQVERRYGKRSLPKSWVGAYWYQLSQQRERSSAEHLLFELLDRLRGVTKRLRGPGPTQPLYGFHPWQRHIEGTAVVHLPWYGRSPWKAVCLQVSPQNARYRVAIDGGAPARGHAHGGMLRVPCPALATRHVRIEIALDDRRPWWLERFGCELAESG